MNKTKVCLQFVQDKALKLLSSAVDGYINEQRKSLSNAVLDALKTRPRITLIVACLSLLMSCIHNKEDNLTCSKYIVIPPTSNQTQAQNIYATWYATARTKLEGCDAIISYRDSLDITYLMNIQNTENFHFQNLKNIHIRNLKSNYNITHIIFFDEDLNHRTLKQSLVYSLSPLKQLKNDPLSFTFEIKEIPYEDESPNRIRLRKYLPHLPNSFFIENANFASINEQDKNQYQELSSKDNSKLPNLISAFGISNVLHPKGYNDNTFESDFYIGVSFPALNKTYRYLNTQDNQETDFHLKFYGILPSLNVDLMYFNALGTSSISFGVGPSLYYLQENNSTAFRWISANFIFGIGHRAFLSDRFYIELQSRAVSMLKPLVNSPEFKTTILTRVMIGLGYYFPEWKSFF